MTREAVERRQQEAERAAAERAESERVAAVREASDRRERSQLAEYLQTAFAGHKLVTGHEVKLRVPAESEDAKHPTYLYFDHWPAEPGAQNQELVLAAVRHYEGKLQVKSGDGWDTLSHIDHLRERLLKTVAEADHATIGRLSAEFGRRRRGH